MKFRSDDTALENEPSSHRLTAVSDVLLKNTVEADPWQNVRAIADKLIVYTISLDVLSPYVQLDN